MKYVAVIDLLGISSLLENKNKERTFELLDDFYALFSINSLQYSQALENSLFVFDSLYIVSENQDEFIKYLKQLMVDIFGFRELLYEAADVHPLLARGGASYGEAKRFPVTINYEKKEYYLSIEFDEAKKYADNRDKEHDIPTIYITEKMFDELNEKNKDFFHDINGSKALLWPMEFKNDYIGQYFGYLKKIIQWWANYKNDKHVVNKYIGLNVLFIVSLKKFLGDKYEDDDIADFYKRHDALELYQLTKKQINKEKLHEKRNSIPTII